jgi:hypothetical protein
MPSQRITASLLLGEPLLAAREWTGLTRGGGATTRKKLHAAREPRAELARQVA